MIDIIIPVYLNYDLVYHQIERWKKIKGDWRLLLCDNTPSQQRKEIHIEHEYTDRILLFFNDSDGIDGERHGGVIDFMIRQSSSDIIGIQDTDFFWLDDDILEYVIRYFKNGYKCIGTELFYSGFEYVNDMYPERHGCLAPCVFGMFVDRQLASEQTFIVTRHEGYVEKRETGWRLRKRIIDENIKSIVLPCVQHPGQKQSTVKNINLPWFYVGNHKFLGVHLVGGTSYNIQYTNDLLNEIYKIIT
jgi:hypothetical protein